MSEEMKVQETEAAEAAEQTADAAQTEAETVQQDDLEMAALKRGDIVKGSIAKIEENQAIVSIGYKYDGIIPLRELSAVNLERAADAVEVGQEVELKVISIDDEKERLILSKRAIDSERAWETLQERFDNNETFEAVVADVVKGGLVVDLGVRGFIPASMVERHFVEDFSGYKGRTVRLKVKELDREANKLILSQKDVLEEEFEAKKQEVIASLEVGQQIEGTVQRLTPFGVFVDIGGVDGLVHISEMAWQHVDKPSDIVQEGQSVTVKVLKVDPENGKISLSMKAAQPGPWETAADQFNVNDIVTGQVKRIVSFGAFVEIAPGVEGLVHISQISHNHIATPYEVLEEGQEIQAKILDMNIADKRISLSIKETEDAPEFTAKPERSRSGSNEEINNENVSTNNQGMSFTLGERFGDKLSKFK